MPRRSIGYEVGGGGGGNEQQYNELDEKLDKVVDLLTTLTEEVENTQAKLENVEKYAKSKFDAIEKCVLTTQAQVDTFTTKMKSMQDTMTRRNTNLNKRIDTCIAQVQNISSKVDIGFASFQPHHVAASPVSEQLQNPIPNGVAPKKRTSARNSAHDSSPTTSQEALHSVLAKNKSKLTRTIPPHSNQHQPNGIGHAPQTASSSQHMVADEGNGTGTQVLPSPQRQDVPMPDFVEVNKATPVRKVDQLLHSSVGDAANPSPNGSNSNQDPAASAAQSPTSNGIVPSNVHHSGKDASTSHINPAPSSNEQDVGADADDEPIEFVFGEGADADGDAASDHTDRGNLEPMEQDGNAEVSNHAPGKSPTLGSDHAAQGSALPNGNLNPNQLHVNENMDIDRNVTAPGQEQHVPHSGFARFAQPDNTGAKPEPVLVPSDDEELESIPGTPIDVPNPEPLPLPSNIPLASADVEPPLANGVQHGVPKDPLDNNAVFNVFPDIEVDEEVMDSSAIPASTMHKPPMKRKRPLSTREVPESSDGEEDDDSEGSIVVTPRRKKTPTRSPKSRRSISSRMKGATISEEEAAENVRRADEMRTRFYTEENAACPTEVRQMYMDAANAGDAGAMQRLVELCMNGAETVLPDGKRLEASVARAKYWLNKLKNHENSDLYTQKILILEGDLLTKGRAKVKLIEQSLKKYEQAWNHGYGEVDGIYKVGAKYYDLSNRTALDRKRKEYLLKSARALLKAYERQHGDAAALLGSIYENQGKAEVNYDVMRELEGRQLNKVEQEDKAKMYFFRSYDWGSAAGHNDCGACFEVSYADIEYSFDMAAETYRRAFELGYASSASNLGILYETGGRDGDRSDPETSVKWFELGYRVRDPTSTYHLGVVYDYGNFRQRDPKKAIQLYEQAIKLSEPRSDCNDIIEMAANELIILLTTCVLLQDECHEAAYANLQDRKKVRLLDECRKFTTWIVALEVKNEEYRNMPTANNAKKKLEELLGDHNSGVVADHIRDLAQDAQNATGDELDEIFRKLCIFVNDRKLEREFGITPRATPDPQPVFQM